MRVLQDFSKFWEKINPNAYIVDFSLDFNISPSFNIENLVVYKGPNLFHDNPLLDEPSPESIFEETLLPSLSPVQPDHPI